MIAIKSGTFKKSEIGLSSNDKKAVTKDAFCGVMLAIQGDTQLIKKYRIKRMHGTDVYWEGHLKQNLCFVYEKTVVNGVETVTFHDIGNHTIYDIVKKR